MFRKSTVALALLLLTASCRLFALGLGEIEMQSALNQPMSADINLISSSGVDLTEITVSLASREAHERLGLSRAKILGDFKFSITEDNRGTAVIHVSSSELVREPYLEFLLEMVWENGQMVREYTVLVDPPVTMQAEPVVPVAPVVQAPKPAPVIAEPVKQTRPAPVVKAAPASFTPAPAPVVKKTAEHYGPIRREEALWTIADRLRPSKDISVQQMMIALQRANPESFGDNNINNLKAGVTLKVPDLAAILVINSDQARAEAGRQYREWRDKRSAAKSAASHPVAEKPADKMPATEPMAVAETESRLKLTPPEGKAEAGSANSGDTVSSDPDASGSGEGNVLQQLVLASEEVEASRAQSEELQSRVQQLEAQIEKMQRLLELKSEPLAGLSSQADSPATEPAMGEEMAMEGEQPVADTSAAESAEAESVTEAVDTGSSEPQGLVDRLMDNPVLAGLGVLVAMLLGGFLWGSTRKHSNAGMFDNEVTLDKHLSDARANEPSPGRQAIDISDPGEFDAGTSAEPQSTPADDVSDPVTEADVYLAYGRIQQAEDVLQAALQDDPENPVIRAKLLRVYHAAGNVAAFDSAAGEFRESVSEDDGQWERIAALGFELSPGNALYRPAVVNSGDDDNVVDFDMDLSGMDEIIPQAVTAETGGADILPESLEFSLDDDIEDDAGSEGVLASSDEIATKLDLARAYLDMEDPEGARSILQEVIEEGDEEQKSEAQSLISKIA